MSEGTKAVFLSYASQDSEAARRICEALRAAGVEVWFDQSELVGGDQWDGKIRKQIAECALFVPIISANTQARREGYFRIEWKLAAQRTHAMADGTHFLLPLLIDGTRDADALVPVEFKLVQWTKLPGGETPAVFCARVGRLLGDVGRDRLIPPSPREPTDARGGISDPALQKKSPRWLWPAIIALAAVAGLALWAPWRKPAAVAVAAALTPARELVAKARTILDQGDELNRETYALAEELLVKAEALDVSEVSAWITHARVSTALYGYGFDRSSARREAQRAQAARALQLAPGSLDAQLAEFDVLITFAQDIPNAILRLQALAGQHPDDWRIPELLGQCYRISGELKKSLVANERALQLSPDRPLLKGNRINLLIVGGQWAEAEATIRTMLQGRSSARLLGHSVYLQLMWSGDLAGAAAALQAWPAWFLLEDRGAGHAALTALWNRDPESALQVVRRFPRDYLRDYLFTGPSAVLSAWAHAQAGNLEAARADWRTVQQVAERELRAAPDDQLALHWKGWALARLGDPAAAGDILQQLIQNNHTGPELDAVGQVVGRWGGLALAAGRTDLALAQLEQPSRPGTRAITRTNLRLNPVFDSVRNDPRFQALLAAAIGPAEKKEADAAKPVADNKSVAVLAFANLSDDKGNEYFSDGISEELLNVLAKVPGLKVTARTSSFHFKGKDTPIPEIAQQLGVAYVVEGSVRKSGDKVRITAQLIKAADGFHVWSDTFTRDLKDIFAVQDEIAGLIAQNLRLTMGASAPGAKIAVNPQAFELYVEARQAWNLRTFEGFDRAEELLNRALALEPDFARAHAALSDVWATRGSVLGETGQFGQRESPLMRRILAAAERAVALDPTSAEAHASLGNAYLNSWKLAEATRTLRHAVVLNPNYASAHQFLGRTLMVQSYFAEAAAELARAAELDPLSHRIIDNYAIVLLSMGRPTEALAAAERALALRPDSVQAAIWRARSLSKLGRHEEAVAQARRVKEDVSSISVYLVEVFVAAGLRSEAEELQAIIAAKFPAWRFIGLLKLGRYEEALAAMDPAAMSPQGFFQANLDPVRNDPRFKQVLATLGLTEADARTQAWHKAHPLPQIPAKQ